MPTGSWSLLKLIAAYAGDALRIRRSSDNAEADIGFGGTGVVDAAAIASHVSGSDAHVVTLYDQASDAHFVQATAARQPKVTDIDGGIVFSGGQHLHVPAGDVSLFADAGQQWFTQLFFRYDGNNAGTLMARAGATENQRTFQVWLAPSGGAPNLNILLRGSRTIIPRTDLPPEQFGWIAAAVRWDGTTARLYLEGAPAHILSVGSASENTGEAIALGARTVGDGSGAGSLLLDGGYIGGVTLHDGVPSDVEIGQQAAAFLDAVGQRDISAIDFDGGLVNSRISTFDVDSGVSVRPRRMLGSWTNYAFKLTGTAGKTPTIALQNSDVFGANHADRHWGWWTANLDSDDWHPFDNQAHTLSEVLLSNDAPFTADTIYVRLLPCITNTHLASLISEWSASPYVHQTASSSAFSIGTTTARYGPETKPLPALDIPALRITDLGYAGPKNIAIITGGMHVGEGIAQFALQGFIDALLGDSAAAKLLRRSFTFLVYPMLNPQGLYAGAGRECPERPFEDFNRLWADPDAHTPETITAVKSAILADTGGVCHFALDFHCRYQFTDTSGFFYHALPSNDKNVAFADAVQANYTETIWREERTIEGMFGAWQVASLSDLRVSAVAEDSVSRAKGLADYRAFGEAIMHGLHDMLRDGAFPLPARIKRVMIRKTS